MNRTLSIFRPIRLFSIYERARSGKERGYVLEKNFKLFCSEIEENIYIYIYECELYIYLRVSKFKRRMKGVRTKRYREFLGEGICWKFNAQLVCILYLFLHSYL